MMFFYSSPWPHKWSALVYILLIFSSLSVTAASPVLRTTEPGYLRIIKPLAEITVSGRVTDATTNEALAGCNVVLKGTQKGTTTDANGDYKIVVPDGNATLVFGFIGFVSQEVAVGNRATINVALNAAASELSQVVVIGYGSASQKDMTGSVKSIKSTDFNRGIINSPEQLLQGKVAGVNVT